MLLFVILTSCATSNRKLEMNRNYKLKYSNSTTHCRQNYKVIKQDHTIYKRKN